MLAFCWVIRVGSSGLIWLSSGLVSLAFRFLIGLIAAAYGKLARNLKCFGYVLSAMASSSKKISKARGSYLRVSIISGIFLTVYLWASSGLISLRILWSLEGISGKSLIVVKCLTALPRACEWCLKPKLRPLDGLLVTLAWSSVILLSSKLEFLFLSLKIPECAREGFFSDCTC